MTDLASELQIWCALFDKRKRELMAEGISEKDADDLAAQETIHLIRDFEPRPGTA